MGAPRSIRRNLTMELSGRPKRPNRRRECTITLALAPQLITFHGPLQRKLGSPYPVTRLTSMMRNGENLNRTGDVPVDDCERKSPKGHATEIGTPDDLVATRRAARVSNRRHEGQVVPTSEAGAAFFVVGNLLLMFQRRFWMEEIFHLRRA